jgi:hypothetical protein
VNLFTDHRPTEHTVTKENRTVISLLRFFTTVSAIVNCRGPRRVLGATASVVALLGVGAFLSTTPAQAAPGPWWHLTLNSRPSAIEQGGAVSEVQQLTVHATGGTFQLIRTERLLGSPQTASLPYNVSAAALRSALEGIYAAGNIEVSGGPGDTGGTHPYAIDFVGELADQPIEPMEASTASLSGKKEAPVIETTRGHADGELVLRATNLGDAAVDGGLSPVEITAELPPKLHAVGISATGPQPGGGTGVERLPCALSTLTCTFSGVLAPYSQIEVRVNVVAEAGVSSAEESGFAIEGGGASRAQAMRPLELAAGAGEPTPFDLQVNELTLQEEGGAGADRAGSHPFQVTNSLVLAQGTDGASLGNVPVVEPGALPKDVNVKLPPGLVGDTQALPRCKLAAFLTFTEAGNQGGDACPAEAAIGVATVDLNEPVTTGFITFVVPVFNLEPAFGEPARFGFYVPIAHLPVLLDTSVRSGPGEDYGITISSLNTTQTAGLLATTVTLWGTPGDPRHGNSRGWGCLATARGNNGGFPCTPPAAVSPPAFQTLPTSCSGALGGGVSLSSWAAPSTFVDQLLNPPLPTLKGCNQLPFGPTISAEPTSNAATSATGLNFDLEFHDEGLSNPEGRAQSDVKKAVVTLPDGFTTNPSVAEGLKACPQAAFEASTTQAGTGCPEESKIGDIEIESPLVGQKLDGSLYIAKQRENPYGNLLTIYLVARNPELGIVIKQALKVTPNPVTGQLTTEVDEIPQLPFSRFHLSFRSGQRAPLITPPACGAYAVGAALYPYSEPGTPLQRESGFQITQGPEGQGCPPGGVPSFHPGLEAGTQNNAAGTYSPFYTHITRKDSEQEITHFSIKLPPGLSGKLAGVAKCSDAAIAAAKSREHELGGQEELDHPSCPASSEVGHTLVGTGVGNVLAYAPGKLYLAGPYHGSQLSIVSITAAKVGPFDLGTVVIREGLKVNPETAQVSVDAAGSDPIPHIVDGIPVHLRDIRIYVDRPSFTINPTSCAKMSTAATVLGSGLDFASEADDQPVTVTSPFQAADCASLSFKPKLALTLKGKTRRGGLPKLTATVTNPKQGAYANIAKTVVTLPPSEFLEQGHIGSSCTRVQFNAGAGNGAQCPKKSILGHARAITPLLDEPVEGLVYLRSNGGERKLPDLVAALHSEDIDINLVGFISSLHKKGSEVSQIRNTFAAVPDAPVSKFTLELFGGKKGLLVNSTNICKGTHKAISEFTGQNGKHYDTEPAVKAQCGKKGKKHKGHGKNSGGKKK